MIKAIGLGLQTISLTSINEFTVDASKAGEYIHAKNDLAFQLVDVIFFVYWFESKQWRGCVVQTEKNDSPHAKHI
jgi:hypothetical protein